MKIGMQSHFETTNIDGTLFGACGFWRTIDTLEIEFRNTCMISGKRFLLRFNKESLTVSADSTIPDVGGLADRLTQTIHFIAESK